MLANYLKVALRQFYKLPVFSAINIIGLVIGLSSSLLIGLWVYDELTWDSYHESRDKLNRVYLNRKDDNGIDTQMAIPLALWHEFANNEPDMEFVTPMNWGWNMQLSYKETKVEKFTYFAEPDFLKMFTVKILKGSPTPLDQPSSVMLTASTAKELFGDEEPIGKTVAYGTGSDLLTVTAVVEDSPQNSSMRYHAVIPFAFYTQTDQWARRNVTNWTNSSFNLYVSFRDGADPAAVEARVKDVITRHVPDEKIKFEVTFLPMSRWHLYDEWDNGKSVAGHLNRVKGFAAIGVFILFIACINFTNLSTARSERRAKEVGVRKSIGSHRKQLIMQFLTETLLMSVAAFVLSVIVVQTVLPIFNQLIYKNLSIDFSSKVFWIASLSIILVTSLAAGAYPAFYLSSFRPAQVLKGRVQVSRGGFLPRRVLVTVQFFFSIVLIIATTIVYQQMNHIKQRDTGYDRDNLVLVWIGHLEQKFESFKTEVLNQGLAVSVTRANSPVTNIFSSSADIEWPGKREDQRNYINIVIADYDYSKTLGMKILEGRDFDINLGDSAKILLNEAAVKYMELENPIGTVIKSDDRTYEVLGVVKDVVMKNPSEQVGPMVYSLREKGDKIAEGMFRLPEGREKESIEGIGKIFGALAPNAIYNYRFADVEYNYRFQWIEQLGKFTNIFAFMAIFVSCLGLFGLAAFSAERRRKEIGIRKVLGASISSLIALLSKEFAILVAIAFAFAAPLTMWQANEMLQQFTYHVDVPWWVVPVTGLSALLLAVITVGTQAFRAASSNPVDSLKTE